MMVEVGWSEMTSRLQQFIGKAGLALLHGEEATVTILEARPPVSDDYVLDWFTFFEDSVFTVAREDRQVVTEGVYIDIKGESFSALEGAPIPHRFEGSEKPAAIDLSRNGDQE